MAVIQDDANAVGHMLGRTPGSITEVDVFGQTPFHLAATNPRILTILLKYKDCHILDRRDKFGFTALETAMIRSSDYCDNGRNTSGCHGENCGCCLCVDLFIGAQCNVRMHNLHEAPGAPPLRRFLLQASELARRKYAYYMKQRRIRTMRSTPSNPHALGLTKANTCEPNTEFKTTQVEENATGSSQRHELSVMPVVAEDTSWVFSEINDPHLGALFHHHGFQPHPSCLIDWPSRSPTMSMNYAYLHWLVSHEVDPFIRSSRGPAVTKDSPKIGLFGAHFAFYFANLRLVPLDEYDLLRPDTGSWDSYMALIASICREDLTDGCRCRCTTRGCSPFTWMMKGSGFMRPLPHGTVQIPDSEIDRLVSHYSRCGLELTSLTYKAAIRYATFGALGLIHTCCDASRLTFIEDEWVDRDDVEDVNEEQAPLLELLENLVEEFEEKAVGFMKADSSGHSLFPQFWTLCWRLRIEEELEKLEGKELTDAERHGAEEIGVRWTVSQQEAVQGEKNPYDLDDPSYWYYELDKICPEYAEPWPEELCRVSELP